MSIRSGYRKPRLRYAARRNNRKSYHVCVMCDAKFLTTGRSEVARLDVERHLSRVHQVSRHESVHYYRTEW